MAALQGAFNTNEQLRRVVELDITVTFYKHLIIPTSLFASSPHPLLLTWSYVRVVMTTIGSHQVTPASRGMPAGLPRLTPVDRKVFPDGLRTSGQHPPIESQIKPFDEFPIHITGRTVWKATDIADKPERWIHAFSSSELRELEQAADAFLHSGVSLTTINKVCCDP